MPSSHASLMIAFIDGGVAPEGRPPVTTRIKPCTTPVMPSVITSGGIRTSVRPERTIPQRSVVTGAVHKDSLRLTAVMLLFLLRIADESQPSNRHGFVRARFQDR